MAIEASLWGSFLTNVAIVYFIDLNRVEILKQYLRLINTRCSWHTMTWGSTTCRTTRHSSTIPRWRRSPQGFSFCFWIIPHSRKILASVSSTWTHLGRRRGRRLCQKDTSTPQWNNLLSRLGFDLWHVLHSRLQVQEVLNHFSLVRYIGIGVGLGANVLVRHALQVGVQIVKYLDQNLTPSWSQLKSLHHMWIDRTI